MSFVSVRIHYNQGLNYAKALAVDELKRFADDRRSSILMDGVNGVRIITSFAWKIYAITETMYLMTRKYWCSREKLRQCL